MEERDEGVGRSIQIGFDEEEEEGLVLLEFWTLFSDELNAQCGHATCESLGLHCAFSTSVLERTKFDAPPGEIRKILIVRVRSKKICNQEPLQTFGKSTEISPAIERLRARLFQSSGVLGKVGKRKEARVGSSTSQESRWRNKEAPSGKGTEQERTKITAVR